MFDRSISREFLLVTTCCRWPLSANAIAAIHAVCAGPIDWPYVLRIARRHRVAGLVDNGLRLAGINMPTASAQTLASVAQKTAQRSLILAAETVRLQQALDAAHIPVLALKGAALAQLAYGSLALKHSRDIDFLISPSDAEAAWHLLKRCGYVPRFPAAQLTSSQWRAVIRFAAEAEAAHPDKRLFVELSWRISENPCLFTGDPFADAQNVVLPNGTAIRTPGESTYFAYLCIHGAKHGWSRLKWLADFNAFVARKNKTEVERLYRHACRVGGGLCAGQGLLLCQRLFALELPEKLADEFRQDRRVKMLVAMALDLMFGHDGETELAGRRFGLTRVALSQFLLGRGLRYFMEQCRLLSVRISDVLEYPLPRSLYFLYPLLRVPLWFGRVARRRRA